MATAGVSSAACQPRARTRGGGERVAAQTDRRRPRVPGGPAKIRPMRDWPAIAVTTRSGGSARLEHGSLLDAGTSKIRRAVEQGRAQLASAECRGERDRHLVASRPSSAGIHRAPDEARAAEERAWKRRPSSSAKATSSSGRVERLGHGQPDQHAKNAVVAAGVGDRVEVRADHQRRGWTVVPREVAERVGARPARRPASTPPRSIAAASEGEASGRVIRPGSSVRGRVVGPREDAARGVTGARERSPGRRDLVRRSGAPPPDDARAAGS